MSVLSAIDKSFNALRVNEDQSIQANWERVKNSKLPYRGLLKHIEYWKGGSFQKLTISEEIKGALIAIASCNENEMVPRDILKGLSPQQLIELKGLLDFHAKHGHHGNDHSMAVAEEIGKIVAISDQKVVPELNTQAQEFPKLIDPKAVTEQFNNHSWTYVESGKMNDPDQFFGGLVKRYGCTEFLAQGLQKKVYLNHNNDVVKITICGRQSLNIDFCIKELRFLLKNPTISTIPRQIGVYLNEEDKERFIHENPDLIGNPDLTILEMKEPNFSGLLAWTEERFEYSARDLMHNGGAVASMKQEDLLQRARDLVLFWQNIQSNIASGKVYMVCDLGPINIGFFKDGSIRIIDAQPSNSALSVNEVAKEINNIKYWFGLKS